MRWLPAFVLAVSLVAAPVAVADESQAWKALVEGGHVALVRHGNAPPGYGGDPPGFKIDDCATQRNLDDKGRAQATALGEAFRQHGVRVDKILSSPWCRCLDTARLMALASVESTRVAAASDRSPELVAALKEVVAGWRGPGTLVVVTHALTVGALLRTMPEQAETIVVRRKPGNEAGLEIVGRIPAPK